VPCATVQSPESVTLIVRPPRRKSQKHSTLRPGALSRDSLLQADNIDCMSANTGTRLNGQFIADFIFIILLGKGKMVSELIDFSAIL
jgi:hypothetical protein